MESTVKQENKWIEQRFDCDITTPFLDSQQLELLEAGFPVKPNREMNMSDSAREIARDCIEEMKQILDEQEDPNNALSDKQSEG